MENIQTIVVISSVFSAIATVVIAIYAVMSHSLAKAIKASSNEHQSRIEDLYQAIIISNIVAAGRSPNETEVGRAKDMFNQNYDGSTKIFKQKSNT